MPRKMFRVALVCYQYALHKKRISGRITIRVFNRFHYCMLCWLFHCVYSFPLLLAASHNPIRMCGFDCFPQPFPAFVKLCLGSPVCPDWRIKPDLVCCFVFTQGVCVVTVGLCHWILHCYSLSFMKPNRFRLSAMLYA